MAGLILAAVFALRDAIFVENERSEQVAHLRALIEDGWWKMCGHHVPPIRTTFYNNLMRDLDAVLMERATRVTFDEARQLRRALRYGGVAGEGDHFFSDAVCDLLLHDLRTVEWLGFPKNWRPNPRPAEPMTPSDGAALDLLDRAPGAERE